MFQARQEAGLGLIRLGKLSGVSHTTIGDIEKGRRMPAVDTVERLARTLSVSPAWLAYGTGAQREETLTEGAVQDGSRCVGG